MLQRNEELLSSAFCCSSLAATPGWWEHVLDLHMCLPLLMVVLEQLLYVVALVDARSAALLECPEG